MRLVGVGAKPLMTFNLVVRKVTLKPPNDSVAFESEHVGRDPVKEPAIVTDHHGAPGKHEQPIFESAQRIDVEVVRWFVE
jgi:hypothetical protein